MLARLAPVVSNGCRSSIANVRPMVSPLVFKGLNSKVLEFFSCSTTIHASTSAECRLWMRAVVIRQIGSCPSQADFLTIQLSSGWPRIGLTVVPLMAHGLTPLLLYPLLFYATKSTAFFINMDEELHLENTKYKASKLS